MFEENREINTELLNMSGIFHIHQVLGIKIIGQLNKQTLITYFEENLKIKEEPELESQVIGFRIINNVQFPPYIWNDKDYKNIADNLIIIEYFWRKESKKKVFKIQNNEIQAEREIDVLEDNRDYIFLILPNLLIFKGAEEAYNAVWEDFFEIIKPIIQFQRNYSFENAFYLKFLEKLSLHDTQLDKDFTIDHVLDLTFEGFKDFLEEIIDIRHLYQISNSIITLMALLTELKIKSGNFDFCLKKIYFTMELKNSGELIIKQQRGDFKDMLHNQRAFHGCYIIHRFIMFYNQWEAMRDTEMTVNPEFKKLIISSLEDNNLNSITLRNRVLSASSAIT